MSIFNQIVPGLARNLTRREDTAVPAENQTYTVKPAYELTENRESWNLAVHLPGVTKENLELTAEEGRIVVQGRVAWRRPDAWTVLYRESVDAPYRLELEHDGSVDTEKIAAELKDGVLVVQLPKTEAIKPRKIAIN